MKFKVESSLSYAVSGPTTFIFNIQVLNTESQKVIMETLKIDPEIDIEEYKAHDESCRFVRLKVYEPTHFTISYEAVVEMNYTILDARHAPKLVPVVELDSYIASFLYPSRYCQSDKLMTFSYNEFGHHKTVYEKVLAITNWIHSNVEYVIGSTNAQTSAMDTLIERVGVCRDFAHLGIALCRAISIPARYYTGYAYQLSPQDFHACFEAYIDGNWIIFDSTKLAPLNGLVKIASGRDAADSAVTCIFGRARGAGVTVNCEVLDDSFVPFEYNGNKKGVSFQ
ncbi:transglutaminase family protein [Algibacter sp.]|nr:transglutaminase family protein [Algibacter sp.]